MGIIESLKTSAKWQDDLERRTEARHALDFYYFRQHGQLEEDIKLRYPLEHKDIQRYRFTAPLTSSLVQQLAMCFQDNPTISFDGVSDEAQTATAELLDSVRLFRVLKNTDRMTELLGKVGVAVRWDGERIRLDILTPDRVVVWQRDDDPTQAEMVGYTIGTNDDPRVANRADLYQIWDAGRTYKATINYEGKILSESDEQPNPYGRIPIVWFALDEPLDAFWLDAGNPFVELNRRINLQLTNLDIGIDYQSFSTLVTQNMNNTDVIPVGVTRVIHTFTDNTTGERGDAKYITPSAQLEAVWKIIQESITWFAGVMGVSAESMTSGSNFSSGFQLKLSKQGVIDHNENKHDLYRETLRDLVTLILETANLYGLGNYPAQAPVSIDFADITVESSPLEREQIRALKIANGTMDAVMALMEDNPDLTEEMAEEMVTKISQRKQNTVPGNRLDTLRNAMGVNNDGGTAQTD